MQQVNLNKFNQFYCMSSKINNITNFVCEGFYSFLFIVTNKIFSNKKTHFSFFLNRNLLDLRRHKQQNISLFRGGTGSVGRVLAQSGPADFSGSAAVLLLLQPDSNGD